MIRQSRETFLVRIPHRSRARRQARRKERVIDAKAVAAVAVPRGFARIRITMSPQVAEADPVQADHEIRRRVQRPEFIDIGAARVEVADCPSVTVRTYGESPGQRLPVR